MRSEEAKQIVLALDGLAAHIETIRNLVTSSVSSETVSLTSGCQHENLRELITHGGSTMMCDDCGLVGVLDAPENNRELK